MMFIVEQAFSHWSDMNGEFESHEMWLNRDICADPIDMFYSYCGC